jgi:GTP-binding protein HflX
MRQLTRTNVEGEDKLFATLDTTVRLLQPETTPRILISDTVGFIKKLPHDLVASFRSTLDEVNSAALLLFIVDGADPNFRSQLQVTQEVIKDLGADQRPARLIINKIDLLEACQRDALREEFPEALFTCAQNPQDMEKLRGTILHFFEKGMSDRDILVPYTQGQALAQIRARARVLKETFDEKGTWVTVRTHAEVHNWIQKQLQAP